VRGKEVVPVLENVRAHLNAVANDALGREPAGIELGSNGFDREVRQRTRELA
jgi:hypothetical protein